MADADFVVIDDVLGNIQAASMTQLLQTLAEEAADNNELLARPLCDRLLQDDRHQATLGNGVMLAHLRLPQLKRPYTIVGRNLNTANGNAAALYVLTLSPARDVAGHMQRLARLTRLFRDQEFCGRLRAAETDADLRTAIMLDDAMRRAAPPAQISA